MPLQWFLLTTAEAQKSHELVILNHHNALLNANDPCKAIKERKPIHEQRKIKEVMQNIQKFQFSGWRRKGSIRITHGEGTSKDDTRENEYDEGSSSQERYQFPYEVLSPETSQYRN